jgi:sec-independent protein translocase protein TatB
MEILGIGASELVFIIIIALLVLGPKDMQKAGRTIGKWLRNLVTSEGWKVFQQTSRELRNLPTRLMREANEDLEKINQDINKEINRTPDLFKDALAMDGKIRSRPMPTQGNSPASSSSPNVPPSNESGNIFQPPSTEPSEASAPDTGDVTEHTEKP